MSKGLHGAICYCSISTSDPTKQTASQPIAWQAGGKESIMQVRQNRREKERKMGDGKWRK
ncbi:MAG: hypothetical protein QXU32_06615 [Nitrososphaerales archaeon]